MHGRSLRRLARSRLALSLSIVLLCPGALAQSTAPDGGDDAIDLETVHVTAEQIARQALGSSVITAEDIERRPPTNDLSEIIRTMPGVNLTGNSASGQYGNNRQIDLRGMGPENTLILVDGKPVGSRDSIRMGRSGERNTRGDGNWVPAEAVERIEVLRGPAAARYGSGASGGVVNIITKKPTGDVAGSLSLYGLIPAHKEEGDSRRAGFQLSGPLGEHLSFRLYGNANTTDADSLDLNQRFVSGVTPPAGREGVRNRDINGMLRWDINDDHVVEFESGFSRQGNIYAGEYPVNGSPLLNALAREGAETNRMYRDSASITHRGRWGDITSRLWISYEGTRNKRLKEGLAGAGEGTIRTAADFYTSRLDNQALSGELNLPLHAGIEHVLTMGFEHRDSRLKDPYAVEGAVRWGAVIPNLDPSTLDGKMDSQLSALFIEDNLYLGNRWILTPGLRYDHQSEFGGNLSPSLNAQYRLGPSLLLKGGVARAFKAPNLYQSNPTYLYYTRGRGCPYQYVNRGAGCYIRGNADLDPETSLNKEVGIEFAPDSGLHASLTYFHNDYKDRIQTSLTEIAVTTDGRAGVFLWENAPKAVVSGFEGNLKIPLLGDRGDQLSWNNNLTYMIENENKTTGQPLSIIPRYTVNTSLDWQATTQLSLYLGGTFYGKQEPPTLAMSGRPQAGAALSTRKAYDLWHLSARYRITPKVSMAGGINNLFDTRLFRESNSNGAGAATYNEPGRAFFASINVGF